MANAPKLGTLLLEHNLVTEDQIDFAIQEQQATGERLGECLLRLGLITDSDLALVLANQTGNEYIDLRSFIPDRELLSHVSAKIASQYQFLVLYKKDTTLAIAIADPFSTLARDQAYRLTGLMVEIYVAGENQLQKMIERFYYVLEHPVEEEIIDLTKKLRRSPTLEVNVEQLVDNLLASAISFRVTDIHITPSDISSRVMFRIDGVLKPNFFFPITLHSRLSTNIKVRSGMDISEQRKPQDGRMSFDFFGESFDIRVSSLRTNFGENLVMRLLPSRGSSTFNISELGFGETKEQVIKKMFNLPYGMVLVTGPTGSGKTTTLYGALREQDAIGQNILTIEDPIEYELLMIRQTQVNTRAGYTFSSAIRTFLRQDPDVMLIGEIRDEETALLAVRAALTGHLVLSTLHTNTALGAIARLKDLGVSPYLLSTALKGIVAQRLIRKLCIYCREPYSPDADILERFDLPADVKYYTSGKCRHCQDTGYMGREVISEILPLSEKLLRLVAEDVSISRIQDAAAEEGFTDLVESGRQKAIDGVTSLDELIRVIG